MSFKAGKVKADPMLMVIDAVRNAGFVDDGHTRTEHVRIPTTRSPVFGKTGGEAVTLGGRLRFFRPGTNVKVTVGKRTTFFYRSSPQAKVSDNLGSANTSDLAKVAEIITNLPSE